MSKNIVKIIINNEEVILDGSNLVFTEVNLNQYIEKEASYYDYYGAKLAIAEKILQNTETNYDVLYSCKFAYYKDEESCSDKLAEAKAKSHDDVVTAKEKVIEAKLNVRLLQQHLKAWDKNHENAQSLGHFLRKSMDKLGGINVKNPNYVSYDEDLVDSIVKGEE